jgi:propanediol dehydratase large subunit
MKVFTDTSQLPALDTLMRETNAAQPMSATPTPAQAVREAAPVSPASALTDAAEALLGMDAWNGTPASSRQLLTNAIALSPGGEEPGGIAQHWADHIFNSLL